MKNLWKRSDDPYLALLSYNSTPIKLGYSPARLLMSQNIRSTVPVAADNVKPQAPIFLVLKQRGEKLKREQKKYFDKRHQTTELPTLHPGDEVWIPDQNTRGTVQREEVSRSYRIVTNEENEIRRNHHHLRNLPEDPNCNSTAQTNLDNSEKDSNNSTTQSSSFHVPIPSGIVTTRSGRISRPPKRPTM